MEAGVNSIHVRSPKDGLLIATNHAVCPHFAGKETYVPESSRKRYNRLYKYLKDKLVDVEDVKKALSDHQGGVCAHEVHSEQHHADDLVNGGCPW